MLMDADDIDIVDVVDTVDTVDTVAVYNDVSQGAAFNQLCFLLYK